MNRTVRWIRTYMGSSEEECPAKIRLGDEIMQFLINRETGLADALDALTSVMLNALGGKYGRRDEFFRFSEQVSRFLTSQSVIGRLAGFRLKCPVGLAAKLPAKNCDDG